MCVFLYTTIKWPYQPKHRPSLIYAVGWLGIHGPFGRHGPCRKLVMKNNYCRSQRGNSLQKQISPAVAGSAVAASAAASFSGAGSAAASSSCAGTDGATSTAYRVCYFMDCPRKCRLRPYIIAQDFTRAGHRNCPVDASSLFFAAPEAYKRTFIRRILHSEVEQDTF